MTSRHALAPCIAPHCHAIALAVGLGLVVGQAGAASKTYTLDADFNLGVLLNVNHNSPNDNQLQLNTISSTFPVLWIANGGEDTISKFDSANNKEIARYRTWFGPAGQAGHQPHLNNPFAGPAPSRTAVDINGNAYVANRHFDGRQPMIMKILTEGGIDRNGNGVIDTSSDLDNSGLVGDTPGEIKDMADLDADGVLDANEITDERIAWAVRVGPAGGLGRSLCIGTDGHLWLGIFNSAQYWKVNSGTGAIIAGPISTSPTAGQPNAGAGSPYGCLVDQSGTLWGANLSGVLTKITNTQNYTAVNNTPALAGSVVASFNSGGTNYGIALGEDASGNPAVFLGMISGGRYAQFNPATNTFSFPGQGANYASAGIGVDGDSKIVTGPFGSGGVTKYNQDGTIVWTAATQLPAEARGVIPDQDGNIWQVSLAGNRLMKYRGTDGAPLGTFPVGNRPYTYSDVNGIANLSNTNPTGTWTVVFDGGAAGTSWGKINWNDLVPAGSSVQVRARAADTQVGLPLQAYQAVSKNVQFAASGRFIQIEARLNAAPNDASPVLFDLSVDSLQTGCDVDGDGDVDSVDLTLIRLGIGQTPAASDARDANADGRITINDVRFCTLRCTRAGCTTN